MVDTMTDPRCGTCEFWTRDTEDHRGMRVDEWGKCRPDFLPFWMLGGQTRATQGTNCPAHKPKDPTNG